MVDVLHRTEVTPDQIDHLGHMNVMFYSRHARVGADALLASLGLVEGDVRRVALTDSYVRHHREQLEGASLAVRGGVLEVSPDRIRLYEELVNTDTDELAANFVMAFEGIEPGTRDRRPFDASVAASVGEAIVSIPEHGLPRSIAIDEDVVASAPSLAELRNRDLAQRLVRTIVEEECEDDGFIYPTAVADLVWGGEPEPGREFRPLEPLPGGGQMGFATMETRSSWARVPQAGDRIQSFGAELEIRDKTMLTRSWVFDVDRDELVAVFSLVNVAFDTGTRRAMVIPDETRQRLARRLHPDLGSPRP